MKDWLLILVTALADGSVLIEHKDHYDNLPRCEYAAEARKTFFPSNYGKQFVCLQVPKQTEHK
jgi:hypothetical protein|tara:strand:- start:1265 stop:1453 length:189 start_codon:yes stop_codon:yes gene_type:complete